MPQLAWQLAHRRAHDGMRPTADRASLVQGTGGFLPPAVAREVVDRALERGCYVPDRPPTPMRIAGTFDSQQYGAELGSIPAPPTEQPDTSRGIRIVSYDELAEVDWDKLLAVLKTRAGRKRGLERPWWER